MSKDFTLLLLGPAGSGKSTFVAGLSKLDILRFISASTAGGANTTKISTTYKFSKNCTKMKVLDCICSNPDEKSDILKNLQALCENNKIDMFFQHINDIKFSKKCSNISVELPIKENILKEDSLFDSIVVRDSRGFGDIDNDNMLALEDLNLTYDVNAILFFSISSIQQPAIFSKIIAGIMSVNLKTPMFLLRRDEDLTQNDKNFMDQIMQNLSKNDEKLSNAIYSVSSEDKYFRLNSFVFNIPEVKLWKGALNISPDITSKQKQDYESALSEIIGYSIKVYERLYDMLVHKMNCDYQEKFCNIVLNNLMSAKALEIVSDITNNPSCIPNGSKSRDTYALSKPVDLYPVFNNLIGEEPFKYEISTRGNQYGEGKIPSYSYSCVNFRNIFYKLVYSLVDDKSLCPLFNTFMDITLKDFTIVTYTGYTFSNCMKDAFKFNEFLDIRNACTNILKHNNLIENDSNEWKNFTFTLTLDSRDLTYSGSKAIAVLIYMKLIESLNLSNSFKKYINTVNSKCLKFILVNKHTEVKENILSRSN